MKKILIIVALAMFLLPLVAEVMPDFKLPNMLMEDVSLSSLLGKGPVIIDFWADYCKPCKEAMPALNALAEKYEELTVVMVSIDSPKQQNRAKSYLKSKNFKFITLFDADKKLASKLNVTNPPHSFILDNEGNIVYSHVGFEAGVEEVYERHIRQLLGLKSPCKENPEEPCSGDCEEEQK